VILAENWVFYYLNDGKSTMLQKPKIYENLVPFSLAYYVIDCSETLNGLEFDLHVLKFFDPEENEFIIDCIDLGLVASGRSKEEADDSLIGMIDQHLMTLIHEKIISFLMENEVDHDALKYYHDLKREFYKNKLKELEQTLNHPDEFFKEIISEKITEYKLKNKIYMVRKVQEWLIEKAA